MPRTREILDFWLEEVGPDRWYLADAGLDADISRRFRADWDAVLDDGPEHWQGDPRQVLAYLILTDQFPRNMFRNDARAFATDDRARKAATTAIHHRMDLKIPEPIRQFFYLPFMHGETTFDQDRCIRLMVARMPETGAENLRHARAHREIIRRFGRFPYRNAALGRIDTPAELTFMAEGGYASVVQALA